MNRNGSSLCPSKVGIVSTNSQQLEALSWSGFDLRPLQRTESDEGIFPPAKPDTTIVGA